MHVGMILFGLGLAATTMHAQAQPLAIVETSPQFHPRRIILQPRGGDASARLNDLHASGNSLVQRVFPRLGGMQVVELAEDDSVPAAVARYQQSGLVEFAEPDYRVSAAALPTDPRVQDGTLWALNNYGQSGGLPDADMDAPDAWDVFHSASNVIVAIVDSGIRYTHEDLAENLWTHPLDGSHGIRVITNEVNGTVLIDTNVWDDNGHGTHLAGIIGAVGNNGKGIAGVTWRVQIMACKFLDNDGVGFNADAITCIEFARSNGASVINLSWGGARFSEGVSNVIRAARSDGIIFAAAAGNNTRNNDVFPYYPANLDLDNVITVGASSRVDGVWTTSNYGANAVDLFAPGAAIYSTTSDGDATYGNENGTSMAAAQVTGALALLRGQSPAAPYSELVARLLSAVDRPPAVAGRCRTNGRLNIRKALDRASVAADPAICGNELACPALPFRLRLTGVPGHAYVVSATTNFTHWSALQTNTTGLDGQWQFMDAASTNLPQRFYRAAPAP